MTFMCPVVILGKGKETMKHSFRKLLSVLLAAVMVFGGAASTVFAFNGEDFVPEIYDIDGTDPSEAQREALVLSLSSTSLEIEVDGSGRLKAEASRPTTSAAAPTSSWQSWATCWAST